MEYLAEICVAIITGGLGFWWFLRKRYSIKSDEFKEILSVDIRYYENQENTLSATVLSLFPNHNTEFNKLLVYVPKRKQQRLKDIWQNYQNFYETFNQFGVFGVVVSEMPHPDFEQTPEAAQLVERKRKKQITGLLNELIEKL